MIWTTKKMKQTTKRTTIRLALYAIALFLVIYGASLPVYPGAILAAVGLTIAFTTIGAALLLDI